MGLLIVLVISQVGTVLVLIMLVVINVIHVILDGMISQVVKVSCIIKMLSIVYNEHILIPLKLSLECHCNTVGSMDISCTNDGGACTCKTGYTGTKCNECADGWSLYNGKCNGKFLLFLMYV